MGTLRSYLPKLQGSIPFAYMECRSLPGDGRWVYIPWRNLRRFLDDICPEDWGCQFSDPVYLEPQGQYLEADQKAICTVRCVLAICGVKREALGSAPIQLISRNGRDATQGDPVERACADAFRSACELFGIGCYLQRQAKDSGWQNELIRRMNAAKEDGMAGAA
ncbi:MAG: hypothetical protein F6K42_25055 [Leptolyngbya sp. SIO1D8]|nr:hypothetical protein [Leptolyngbya sp. SIO1D8]